MCRTVTIRGCRLMSDKDKQTETAKELADSQRDNQASLEEAFPTSVNDQITD